MLYTVLRGHRYRADIVLTGMTRVFASESAVREKLQDAGFSSVEAWHIGSGEYLARGIWDGATTTVELPPEIVDVEDLGRGW